MTTTSSGCTELRKPGAAATLSWPRAVDSGKGVGPKKNGVNLDLADAISDSAKDVVREA